MAHAVHQAGVTKRLVRTDMVHPARLCQMRASTIRFEQIEPSPSDVPVTRARYSAFAPPTRPPAEDSARAQSPGRQPVTRSPQLSLSEGPLQPSTPLTDRQLEEFSTAVLSNSSSIWSAQERNLPASTSDSSASADEVLAKIRGKGPSTIIATLKALSKRGEFDTVIRVLQDCSKPTLEVVCKRWRYAEFLEAVGLTMKSKPAVQFAKLAVPFVQKPGLLLTSLLQTCAKCRDVDGGLTAIELARKSGVPVDSRMLTTLIKVCKSVGNVDKAYRVYLELRSSRQRVDGHVFGSLIASCAEAMKRDLTVVHERKDQYVLLERAFHYVEDAEAAGVTLEVPVWNALMVCAGRSGELNRAFQVLAMMQQRGIVPNAATYGSLIESCVCARQPEKALRVFEVALAKGFVSEVKIYTQALSACMLPLPGAWERALQIYAELQRASVRPDKKLFACLMAVAGRCGRLDSAFELLSEMAAEGIRPSGSSVSALIHACLDRGNLALARRVYDLCARQGVYPVVSQFNRMMDVYASECRFGEVVSLLCDMVSAGRQPNLNTFRVLINAAELTDQAGLAFQVFALMHANRVQILQLKYAQTIYYMLIKACFNQTRFLWTPSGYPPAPPPQQQPQLTGAAGGDAGAASLISPHAGPVSPQAAPHAANGTSLTHLQRQHSPLGSGPAGGLRSERRAEADKLLEALGGSRLRRGAHQSNPFDGPPDSIDWTSHALSAFHHMITRGYKPTLELLDLLLGCMRAKMLPPETGLPGAGPDAAPAAPVLSPFVPLRPRGDDFEVAFESRAFLVLEEAISRGLLPQYDPDAPLVLNMRRLPPSVAEVYVLYILRTLERRSERRKAAAIEAAAERAGGGGGASVGSNYQYSITLLVPPFDPDLVKWPSYLERLVKHYTAEMSAEEQARLRYRNPHRRSRSRRNRAAATAAEQAMAAAKAAAEAAGAASTSEDEEDVGTDGTGFEFGQSRSGGAGSSYDELEAAISGSDDDDVAGSGDGETDPWADEDFYGWEAEGADFAGGRYLADSTTGLAVAATLRRMKVWMDMDFVNGTVTVFAVELARWLKRRRHAAEAARPAAAAKAAAKAAAEQAAAAGAPTGPDGPLAAPDAGESSGTSTRHVGAPGGMVGAAAVGMTGAMVGARGLMGRGGPMGRGTPMEQQTRNIRLGMMGASPSAGTGPSGRGSGGAAGAFSPPPSAGQAPAGQQQHQQHQQQASGRGANGESSLTRARRVSWDRNSDRNSETPVLTRPGPLPVYRRAPDSAPNGNGNGNGHHAASEPAAQHTNGSHGEATNGNGQHQQQQQRNGALPSQQPDARVIAVPQQVVQVALGPGMPVNLPRGAPEASAPAATAPAGATAAASGG